LASASLLMNLVSGQFLKKSSIISSDINQSSKSLCQHGRYRWWDRSFLNTTGSFSPIMSTSSGWHLKKKTYLIITHHNYTASITLFQSCSNYAYSTYTTHFSLFRLHKETTYYYTNLVLFILVCSHSTASFGRTIIHDVHRRRGFKEIQLPIRSSSLAAPAAPAPIAATTCGTFGCSWSYNTCTSLCRALLYTCRFSRATLSSSTRA
jgi:hypothetical protein